MPYYTYLIVSKINKKLISYVGYTVDIDKRIKKHNASKGAKFTRGKEWILIYKKKISNKKFSNEE